MKSYAAVDRIEGKYAVCEVELIDVETSARLKSSEKETEMVDVILEKITTTIREVQEGDIIVVEYNEGEITYIYSKDDQEKQRRIEIISKIMKKL